ncbi:hypothetical protein [Hyphomicrobium sp.]|uniref:hypothetical protein n=1 Tax=Hyphomicrobium sp. TaxID=82 RepID=UPI001D7E364C|nr:hypothetical protein [Hyphomicrobium sp.]MBY0559258.1 hypothetical protein [Hyphomicrobium sp.]
MRKVHIGKIGFVVVAAALTCGCANSGFDLSTASVTSPEKTAAKSDPVCASLASQITTLKGDGTIERLEKAADGKGDKVSVKRAALQKQAELNKAYGEYQTRCGTGVPNQVASQQAAKPAAAATTPAAN